MKFFLIFCILFTSCHPIKKALRVARENPKDFAGYCAEVYPCVLTSFPDTVVRSDSSKYIAAIKAQLDYIDQSRAYYETLLGQRDKSICDTGTLLKTIASQDATIISLRDRIKHIPPVHDSIPKPYAVKDSAALQVVVNQRDLLINASNDLIGQRNKFHDGRDRWRIIALCALSFIALQFAWKFWLSKYFTALKIFK